MYEDQTQTQTRTVTVSRPVYKQVMLTFDINLVHAQELSGVKLNATALRSRMGKQGLILVSGTNQRLPDEFTLLFKPETIVLDLTRSMPMPPAAPPPPGTLAEVAPASLPAEVEMPNNADVPPQFRLASIDAEGNFLLRAVSTQTMTSTRQHMKTESRLVDGKEVSTIVCVPISVTERRESSHTVTYPVNSVAGVTVDAKAMGDQHREALRLREIPVVVSANGKPLDSFWLQNIRPKMLALTVPAATPPVPPETRTQPMPAPMPLPPMPLPPTTIPRD